MSTFPDRRLALLAPAVLAGCVFALCGVSAAAPQELDSGKPLVDETGRPLRAVVIVPEAPLRDRPDASAHAVVSLRFGETMQVQEFPGSSYARVRTARNESGWVQAREMLIRGHALSSNGGELRVLLREDEGYGSEPPFLRGAGAVETAERPDSAPKLLYCFDTRVGPDGRKYLLLGRRPVLDAISPSGGILGWVPRERAIVWDGRLAAYAREGASVPGWASEEAAKGHVGAKRPLTAISGKPAAFDALRFPVLAASDGAIRIAYWGAVDASLGDGQASTDATNILLILDDTRVTRASAAKIVQLLEAFSRSHRGRTIQFGVLEFEHSAHGEKSWRQSADFEPRLSGKFGSAAAPGKNPYASWSDTLDALQAAASLKWPRGDSNIVLIGGWDSSSVTADAHGPEAAGSLLDRSHPGISLVALNLSRPPNQVIDPMDRLNAQLSGGGEVRFAPVDKDVRGSDARIAEAVRAALGETVLPAGLRTQPTASGAWAGTAWLSAPGGRVSGVDLYVYYGREELDRLIGFLAALNAAAGAPGRATVIIREAVERTVGGELSPLELLTEFMERVFEVPRDLLAPILQLTAGDLATHLAGADFRLEFRKELSYSVEALHMIAAEQDPEGLRWDEGTQRWSAPKAESRRFWNHTGDGDIIWLPERYLP